MSGVVENGAGTGKKRGDWRESEYEKTLPLACTLVPPCNNYFNMPPSLVDQLFSFFSR